jgi:hypothetical protein
VFNNGPVPEALVIKSQRSARSTEGWKAISSMKILCAIVDVHAAENLKNPDPGSPEVVEVLYL